MCVCTCTTQTAGPYGIKQITHDAHSLIFTQTGPLSPCVCFGSIKGKFTQWLQSEGICGPEHKRAASLVRQMYPNITVASFCHFSVTLRRIFKRIGLILNFSFPLQSSDWVTNLLMLTPSRFTQSEAARFIRLSPSLPPGALGSLCSAPRAGQMVRHSFISPLLFSVTSEAMSTPACVYVY